MNFLKLSLAGLAIAVGTLFVGVGSAEAYNRGWGGGYGYRGGVVRGPVYRAPVYGGGYNRGFYSPRVYSGYRGGYGGYRGGYGPGNFNRGGSGVIVSPRGIGIRF